MDVFATVADERQDLAQQWISTLVEWRTLNAADDAPKTLIQRLAGKMTDRRADVRRHRLLGQVMELTRCMRNRSVGACPHEWGVLSGGDVDNPDAGICHFFLESTLDKLVSRYGPSPEVAEKAQYLLSCLPNARAHAELGDPADVTAIEELLLWLVDHPALSDQQRQDLIHHLPARCRPIPTTLAELERTGPPVTLRLRLEGVDLPRPFGREPRIFICDIVTAHEFRGHGIGASVLQEVCNYADLHQLPIEGELQPGPGTPDEAVTTLARWYARRGFTQGDREPDEWQRWALIRRNPQSVHIGQ